MENSYESLKLFYIGKEKVDGEYIPLVYKNKDFLTHAAIIGMTGSGKTGLGISLLEEAAIDNIPSIIIDPKGDMTNLLLTFPSLKAQDFKPWVEEQEAANSGKSVDEFAEDLAKTWKKGIEGDFQSASRIQKLKDSANYTIYTPGSDAGVQVSILSSFNAPSKEVMEDEELFTSLVTSTSSSILALIGEKSDSNSKEMVLLNSIFFENFKNGKNLLLEELISQIITPAFEKIGVFSLETFYPKDERLKLALKLNALIANPSFSSWIKGESLNISKMLYDENGKANVSIFTISHLSDSQRMFFVTILLNEILTWMRRQEGTSSLKALLYMDEIFGYFPPLGNPPSKEPMLTLLKQARGFGVGVVLATQNPVDIDYKGLSNIGTWFLGRLQTKQDINRVIDGLSGTDLNKNEIANLLLSLEKRNFILSSASEDGIKLFKTRWALSYLKGPLTKDGISSLMKDVKKKIETSLPKKHETGVLSAQKPIILSSLPQKYLYRSHKESYKMLPFLLCSSTVSFASTPLEINTKKEVLYKYYLAKEQKNIDFFNYELLESENLSEQEREETLFYELPAFIQNEKNLTPLQKKFTDFLYQNEKFTIYKNDELKLTSKVNESLDDFKLRVKDRQNERVDEEVDRLKTKFKKQNDSLDMKLSRLYERVEKEEKKISAKRTDSIINIGTLVLGAFFGSKNSRSTSIGKVMSGAKNANKILKENNNLSLLQTDIENILRQKELLQEMLEKEVRAIKERFEKLDIKEIFIKPKRSDIYNTKLELLWEEELG